MNDMVASPAFHAAWIGAADERTTDRRRPFVADGGPGLPTPLVYDVREPALRQREMNFAAKRLADMAFVSGLDWADALARLRWRGVAPTSGLDAMRDAGPRRAALAVAKASGAITIARDEAAREMRVTWSDPAQGAPVVGRAVAPLGWVAEQLAPFHSVNNYGLFAVMTTQRNEIILEGSNDGTNWLAYEFKYKPGDVQRRPAFVAPFQPRLDWQMWFAASATPQEYPWTLNLVWKLLHNDPVTLGLFAANPFPGQPPRFIRAVVYRYHFARPGDRSGRYWTRERVGLWLPPLSADNARLRSYIRASGWRLY